MLLVTRKIGKLLRGGVRPFSVVTACMLGTWLGFSPGLGQAPLWTAGLVALLVLLSANLFVATAAAGVGALLALLLMPVNFAVGQWLLDGPMGPAFGVLINAPVTAWLGLAYYVVPGGMVVGGVIGVVESIGLLWVLRRFRRAMAAVESGSQRYAKWTGRRWVRTLGWLLLGGRSKKTYAELSELKGLGNPIRPLGAAAVVLVVVLLFLMRGLLTGPVVGWQLQSQLERMFGATVDVGRVELDTGTGRLEVHHLAITDPDDLERDLWRSTLLTADVDVDGLLRRRLAVDEVVSDGGVVGAERAVPGRRTTQLPEPSENDQLGLPQVRRLEELVRDAQRWRARLTRVRSWLERIAGPPDPVRLPGPMGDWVRRRTQTVGLRHVRAEHLVEGAPRLLLRRGEARNVVVREMEDRRFTITGENVSTHPELVDGPPRITVRSDDGAIDLSLAPTGWSEAGGLVDLDMTVRDLPVGRWLDGVQLPGGLSMSEGRLDVRVDGSAATRQMDLPIRMTVRGASFGGLGGGLMDELPVTLTLVGPLDNPGVRLDAAALGGAGAAVVRERAGGLLRGFLGGGDEGEDD
jgi:uncharacterized protein (TIGR03546 family)